MVLCGFINWGGAARGEKVERGMDRQRRRRWRGEERERGHNGGSGGRERRTGGGAGEPHQVLIDFLQL